MNGSSNLTVLNHAKPEFINKKSHFFAKNLPFQQNSAKMTILTEIVSVKYCDVIKILVYIRYSLVVVFIKTYLTLLNSSQNILRVTNDTLHLSPPKSIVQYTLYVPL